MKLRMISYGYEMINGVLNVLEEEANIVLEIFRRYGEGETLKGIADDLTERKIIFFQDKCVWNKNMIARMIENRRYIGADGYPRIISDEDYERIYNLKDKKGVKKSVCSTEIEYLRGISVCAQCGSKLYRHGTWSVREKWFCPFGCKTDIYVGDKELTTGIQNALKHAKMDSSILDKHSDSNTYHPTLEIIRSDKDIDRMIDQSNVQFTAVKKLIFQCVEKKFICCTENKSEVYTDYVLKCFDEWNPVDGVDIDFMRKVVDRVFLEKDGSVIIKMINEAEIKGVI